MFTTRCSFELLADSRLLIAILLVLLSSSTTRVLVSDILAATGLRSSLMRVKSGLFSVLVLATFRSSLKLLNLVVLMMMVLLVMLYREMLLLIEQGLVPMIITRLVLGNSRLPFVCQMNQSVLVYASP